MPRVTQAWYVICTSAELKPGAQPLQRMLHGSPLAIWRTESGQPSVVLDRCPHRGVPLSSGRVSNDRLQCQYHGWEFDHQGRCKRVPALIGEPDRQGRCVPSHPVQEQQGLVWTWADPKTTPEVEPPVFPFADKPGYLTVRQTLTAKASLHAVAENALDVPHTAFLHGGLFRNDSSTRNTITCVIERTEIGVSCEYLGEPRPEGLVARLLSPSGGLVTHSDHFRLPCVVEVEYAIGDENHIINAAALTPVDDHETILYAIVSIRSRIPSWILKPVVQPLALKIFNQDAKIFVQQTASLEHFGAPQYVSTEVDLLGPHILRLLQRAANPAAESAPPYRAEVQMEV
jgi:phenylpropionate dioxygenase-like ring-hydroxylating dioxygenase large terminal subunit